MKKNKNKEEYYCQCLLIKENQQHVAWIPKKFAKKGASLYIPELGDNWKVEKIWMTKPASFVIAASQAHKHQRKASDI